MEQLKPVLEQKFWILLALAIILPIVAWWSMSNEVSAEISSRRNQIDQSFKEVPANAKTLPNSTWAKQLAAVNEQRTAFLTEQSKKLWESQKHLYRFPVDVEEFRGPFRGKFTNLKGRDLYRHRYEEEIRQLRQIVDPLQPSGKGVVYLPENALQPRVPEGKWANIPGDLEIWDAQEDIWLMTAVFNAVKETNKGKQSIAEAPIREVVLIRLRGGSREALDAMTSGTTAPTTTEAAPKKKRNRKGKDDDGPQDTAVKELLDEESGASRGSRGGAPANMSFDLNEVFGGGGDQADMSLSSPSAGSTDAGGLNIGQGAAERGSAPKNTSIPRYIDGENPNRNSVTRGFFIYVVMDHREMPEFLANLSSMPFPCEISRVHMTKYSSENRAPNFPETESTAAAAPVAGKAATARPVDPAVETYQRAMSDPTLASVAVAGILTMYRPPAPAAGAAVTEAGKAASPAAPAEPNKAAATPAATATPAAPWCAKAPAAAPQPEKKGPETPAASGKESPASAPGCSRGGPAAAPKADAKTDQKTEKNAAPVTPPAKPAEAPKQPPPGAPAQPAVGAGR